MPYLLLIVEPQGQRAERGVEAGKQVYAQMGAFAADLKSRGVLLGVESLASDAKGTRVQVRDGRVRALDGPAMKHAPRRMSIRGAAVRRNVCMPAFGGHLVSITRRRTAWLFM